MQTIHLLVHFHRLTHSSNQWSTTPLIQFPGKRSSNTASHFQNFHAKVGSVCLGRKYYLEIVFEKLKVLNVDRLHYSVVGIYTQYSK